MRFSPTDIAGVVVVDVEPIPDPRGSFARLFCPDEFAKAGHPFTPVQTSLSHTGFEHKYGAARSVIGRYCNSDVVPMARVLVSLAHHRV